METAKLNIKQWAEDDRPREKMMQKGASALSNAELLAILIGSGTVEESAVGLMKRVMADCDNRLKTLGRMSLEELTGNVEVWDKETGKKKEGAPLQRAGRSQGRGHHGRLRIGAPPYGGRCGGTAFHPFQCGFVPLFPAADAGPVSRGMLCASDEPGLPHFG